MRLLIPKDGSNGVRVSLDFAPRSDVAQTSLKLVTNTDTQGYLFVRCRRREARDLCDGGLS